MGAHTIAGAATAPGGNPPATAPVKDQVKITTAEGRVVQDGEKFAHLRRGADGTCDTSGNELALSFESATDQPNHGSAKVWIDDNCDVTVHLAAPDAAATNTPSLPPGQHMPATPATPAAPAGH